MTKTFDCPFCANIYVVLPTLAGRTVRCTSCKNPFSLGYDGIARKVELFGDPRTDSDTGTATSDITGALERREQGELAAPQGSGPVRSHTRAIKKDTERIKNIRSSLKEAAQRAVVNIETSGQEDKQKKQVTPAVPQRARPVGRSRAERWIPRFILLSVLGFVLLWTFFPVSIERVCLEDFCRRLDGQEVEYPHRIAAYQKKMWLATRNGRNSPPIILNIHSAKLEPARDVAWLKVVTACSVITEGMEFNRKFAIWNKVGDASEIEKLWQEYPQKRVILGFYDVLKTKKLKYIRFVDFPQILVSEGLDRELIYMVSLMLAGTSTAEGMANNVLDLGIRGGDMPTRLRLSEFRGSNGNVLADGGGHYDIAVAQDYCGLIANFSGFAQQSDQCKVLDVQLAKTMSDIYNNTENPLCVAAYESLQNLAESIPVLAVEQ